MINSILVGDCLVRLKDLPDNSVDSVVTDPPYELGFMGKSWDNSGIANNPDMWREVLRVLKPGGHLLSFSGTRTYHRQAVAIEDAGFEIRDMVEWIYSTRFPKSLNVKKQLEKQGHPDADKYNGIGTALKPAHEPICLARKPLAEKTVAQNVLKYGTGGINIDKSRVGTDLMIGGSAKSPGEVMKTGLKADYKSPDQIGRFPANLIHDGSDEVVSEFPNTNKGTASGYNFELGNQDNPSRNVTNIKSGVHFGDSGSAARFFKSFLYCPKASKSERDRGCEELDKKEWIKNACVANRNIRPNNPTHNSHPTVKPLALMKYLIQMVTPDGGTVLDPFAGSGSTLVAAKELGYQYIGIELTPEYIPIIEARLSGAELTEEQLSLL